MKVDVQQVVQRLSAQIADMAVRLAVAEARLAALTEPNEADGTGADHEDE